MCVCVCVCVCVYVHMCVFVKAYGENACCYVCTNVPNMIKIIERKRKEKEEEKTDSKPQILLVK